MTGVFAKVTEKEARPTYRLGVLGRQIASRIEEIQPDYRDRKSWALEVLAKLRRGVGKEPGSTPEHWYETLARVRLPLSDDEEVSPQERAAHGAMTLYAVHQQSRSKPMHRRGRGLGSAVRTLCRKAPSDEAVLRRFHALGTAAEFREVMHHARALISLLRTYEIALDYGRLADQLADLQNPDRRDGVRLAWGREFHRMRGQNDQDGSENEDIDSTKTNASATEGVATDLITNEGATTYEEGM